MKELTLGFAGDVSLAVLNRDRSQGIRGLVQQCRPFTDIVDLAIANFESVIIPDTSHVAGGMAVPEDKCRGIEGLHFHVFSLANNHILDRGPGPLNLTMDFLQRSGIQTVGAGNDIAEAEAPLVLDVAGMKIGFLSVTDATHYRAKKRRAGVAPLARRSLVRSVRKIRDAVDLLVISIHSDLEFTNLPAPWKVRLSRFLVRSGADLVIHHHPHTLQGIEQYRGGLIAYSLGNFVFPLDGSQYMSVRNGFVRESVFLTVKIRETGPSKFSIDYDAIPAVIGANDRIEFAQPKVAKEILTKLESYGRCLKDPRRLRDEYFKACVSQAKQFALGLYYSLRKEGISAALRFANLHLSTRMHRNWMRGLFTFGVL